MTGSCRDDGGWAAQCLLLGRRMAQLGCGSVGIGCRDGEDELYARIAALGAREAGGAVLDFGRISRPGFQFAMGITRCGCGLHFAGRGRGGMAAVGELGLPLTRRQEEFLYGRAQEATPPEVSVPGGQESIPGLWELYCSQVGRMAPRGLQGQGCVVKCSDPLLQRQAREVLFGLGCQMLSGPVLWLDPGGQRLAITTPRGELLPFHRLLEQACRISFARGRDVALPQGTAMGMEQEAALRGRRVLRYSLSPGELTPAEQQARAMAAGQLWERDGLMLAVTLLAAGRREGQWPQEMPHHWRLGEFLRPEDGCIS